MTVAPTRATSRSLVILMLAGASLAACATPQPRYANRLPGGPSASTAAPNPGAGGRYKVGDPYQVAGVWYAPHEQPNYDETGIASWYGDAFNMQPTANGETFDMTAISAAHTTLPLPCIVEVTNLDNGRKIQVRVNDRGPFVAGRIIDLSHAAARELGYDQKGLARVRVRYVGPASLATPDAGLRYASNSRTSPAGLPPAMPAPRASADTPPPYAAPVPQAPVAVASQPLPPIASAPASSLPTAHAASAVETASNAYRVQAGAFSDQANAQRVAASLGTAGAAVIEPVQRNGVTIYRVILPGGVDEGEAWVVRDRVASLGYADARVLRPF